MATTIATHPTQVYELQGYDALGYPKLVPDMTASVAEGGSQPGSPSGAASSGDDHPLAVKRKSFLWPSRQLKGRAVVSPGAGGLFAADATGSAFSGIDKPASATSIVKMKSRSVSGTKRTETDSKEGFHERRKSGKFYSKAPSLAGDKGKGARFPSS